MENIDTNEKNRNSSKLSRRIKLYLQIASFIIMSIGVFSGIYYQHKNIIISDASHIEDQSSIASELSKLSKEAHINSIGNRNELFPKGIQFEEENVRDILTNEDKEKARLDVLRRIRREQVERIKKL